MELFLLLYHSIHHLLLEIILFVNGYTAAVDHFHVPLLVTDLAERPMTDVTIVGLESSVLSEVVSKIARFFKHLVASLV